MTFALELVAVAALILLNGFFVGAEYGLVTSRRTRIMELEHEGNRGARQVLRITSDPPRFIAAMQLGVTIASLAIGALDRALLDRPLSTNIIHHSDQGVQYAWARLCRPFGRTRFPN